MENKKNRKWWQWMLIIAFLPFSITSWVIHHKDWSDSKKTKIVSILWLVFLVIGIYNESFPECAPSNEKTVVTETVNNNDDNKQTQQLENSELTKNEAMAIIQNYKVSVNLEAPETPKGTTILEYYEIRGKIPAITNIGWFAEEIESGKYLVSYKQKVNDLDSNPRWEVSRDSIRAINGIAITITPEFGPKEKEKEKEIHGTELEKQVYQTFNDLYMKYDEQLFAENPIPTRDQLDEIEERALLETANKFEITTKEVGGIFIKLDMQKYSQ